MLQVEYGSWKAVRELGHGSYGRVYEIENTDELGLVSRAALKIIEVPRQQSEVDTLRSTGMSDQDITDYFHTVAADAAREITLMSRLQGISNIVNYQSHTVKKHPNGFGWDIYIQMELLTPLTRYTAAHEITPELVVRLGIDLCRALERFQQAHLIHRDIKPDNIFVSEQGDFKLGDLGIARIQAQQGAEMTRVGTCSYMAPEVFHGRPYDARADQYSLGIVLYQLLNHNLLPFMTHPEEKGAANRRRMSGEPLPPLRISDGCYAPLAQVVEKACRFDPQDRYRTPGELRMALEAVQRERTVRLPSKQPPRVTVQPPVTPPPEKPAKKPRHKGRIALAAVMTLLVLAAAGVWLRVGYGWFQNRQSSAGGVTWNIQGQTLTVSGSGAMEDYTQDQPAPWQSQQSEIRTVVIEDGVTSVGAYAFANCGGLVEVEMADTVLSVGESAFASCGALEQIRFSDSLTEIGERAFGICVSLSELELPNSLEEIGDAAFYGCSAVETVYIPENVVSLGDTAFWGCEALEEVVVSGENQTYTSLDGVLMDKAQTRLLLYPNGKAEKVYTVPEGVTVIGSYAFSGCSGMSITVPEGVTTIGERAFYACKEMKRLELPESLTEIGTKAFQECELEVLVFAGDAPVVQSDAFLDSAISRQYGGSVAWNADETEETESISSNDIVITWNADETEQTESP